MIRGCYCRKITTCRAYLSTLKIGKETLMFISSSLLQKNIENRFVVKRACNQQHLQYPMMCVLYQNFDTPVDTTNALENVNERGGLRSSQGKKMCLSGTVNTMIAMLKGHI